MNLKLSLLPFVLGSGLWLFSVSFSSQVMRVNPDPYSSEQQEVVVPLQEPIQSGSRYGGLLLAFGSVALAYFGVKDLRKKPENNTSQRQEVPPKNRRVVQPSPRQVSSATVHSDIDEITEEDVPISPDDNRADRKPIVYSRGKPSCELTELKKLFMSHMWWLIYGEQGSGKTSKGGRIAAWHLERGDRVIYVNPLVPFKFFEGLEVFGKGEDFTDAASGIELFVNEANKRMRNRGEIPGYNPFDEAHWFLLADEITYWEANINPDILKLLIEVGTQKLRQSNMSMLFTGHGKTLTCMGGINAGRGKNDVILRQMKMLRCVAKDEPLVEGGKICAGYAVIEWIEDDRYRTLRIKIPHTFQPPNAHKENGMSWYDFRPLIPKLDYAQKIEQDSKEQYEFEKIRNVMETSFSLNNGHNPEEN